MLSKNGQRKIFLLIQNEGCGLMFILLRYQVTKIVNIWRKNLLSHIGAADKRIKDVAARGSGFGFFAI